MNLERNQLNEVTELMEDSVEYFCDNELVSGELAWNVLQALATAKLAEMNGELLPN